MPPVPTPCNNFGVLLTPLKTSIKTRQRTCLEIGDCKQGINFHLTLDIWNICAIIDLFGLP
jgi:hypothetical protein